MCLPLVALGLLGSGCKLFEDDESDAVCVEGTRRSCSCAGGRSGFQRCEFGQQGPCECTAPRGDARSTSSDDSEEDDAPVAGKGSAGSSSAASAGAGGSRTTSMPRAGSSADAASGTGASDPSNMSEATPPPAAEPALGLTAEPTDDAAMLFDQTKLRTYDVQVNPADLASIDVQPSAESYVPARLLFEGAEYGPLMMRYKGSNGSFQPPCTMGGLDGPKAGKCSFKLGFDEVDPEARFFGVRKLNFHSLNADTSMLRERLGYTMFREFGVAASRAVHVRVLVNGVFQGLYAAVEQIDGRFTRARFTDGGEGNLYKEVWPIHDDPASYLNKLETNEDEMPSVQNFLDFKRAIDTSADATAGFLDRDYLMRFIASDRVMINDDGLFHFYCQPDSGNPGTNHNYYWYEAQGSARFWIIPWDLDHSFEAAPWAHVAPEWSAPAACTCNPVAETYQTPASCDPLVNRFASWRDEYDRKVDEFLAGPFAKANVDAKLDTWTSQIEPTVLEAAGLNQAPTHAEWVAAVEELRGKVESARTHRGYAY